MRAALSKIFTARPHGVALGFADADFLSASICFPIWRCAMRGSI